MQNSTLVVQTSFCQFVQSSTKKLGELAHADILHIHDLPPIDVDGCDEVIGHIKKQLKLYPIKLALSLSPQWSRQVVLALAAKVDFCVVDLACFSDHRILTFIDSAKLIVCRHCVVDGVVDGSQPLEHQLATVSEWITQAKKIPACCYHITVDHDLVALSVLAYQQQDCQDLVVYNPSVEGLATRFISLYRGKAWLFCDFYPDSNTSLNWLYHNYHLPQLPDNVSVLFGIIGDSIAKSFSPMVHNHGLQSLGLDGLYLPFAIESIQDLSPLSDVLLMLNLPLRGLTITAPFKQQVVDCYPHARDLVAAAASANVLQYIEQGWLCQSTDDAALVALFAQFESPISDMNVAVIGCGCSGRVAASTAKSYGATVSLFNRGDDNLNVASQVLKLNCYKLDRLDFAEYDLIINTVPFEPQQILPFDVNSITATSRYIDYVYNPYPNELLSQVLSFEIDIDDGFEVLKFQLLAQFNYLTGKTLPIATQQLLVNQLTQVKLGTQ